MLQRQTYVERFMFDTVGENMALEPSEIALSKRMCFPAWLVKLLSQGKSHGQDQKGGEQA